MPDLPTPSPLDVSSTLRAAMPECFASPAEAGGFKNPWAHAPLPGFSGVLKWKMGKSEARPRGYKARPLSVPATGLADFEALEGFPTRLFWIGHASFLIVMDGLRVVIDPIFGRAGGLVPRVTPPAAEPEALGEVDVVLVTHGHHDHLDPSSLKRIALANQGRTLFVVPKGLASTLPKQCTRVVELSWWEYITLKGVRLHLVPAQHWHQRGPFDTNKSLWGGYVVEGTHRIYHSGDTGYFAGFRAVGEVFGSIDAACLPLGAYEPKWFMSTQHMSPDESVAAYHDLHATHFVGMHWGTYDLSDETIDAGPTRLSVLSDEQNLPPEHVHVLAPGGSIALSGERAITQATIRHAYVP